MVYILTIVTTREGEVKNETSSVNEELSINYEPWCEMVLKNMRRDGIIKEVNNERVDGNRT